MPTESQQDPVKISCSIPVGSFNNAQHLPQNVSHDAKAIVNTETPKFALTFYLLNLLKFTINAYFPPPPSPPPSHTHTHTYQTTEKEWMENCWRSWCLDSCDRIACVHWWNNNNNNPAWFMHNRKWNARVSFPTCCLAALSRRLD